MNYNQICVDVVEKLNKNSLLRRCLRRDILPVSAAPAYYNADTTIVVKDIPLKGISCEAKTNRFIDAPMIKNKLAFVKSSLDGQSYNCIFGWVYRDFLRFENNIIKRLLESTVEYTDNIIREHEIKDIGINAYNIITPKYKQFIIGTKIDKANILYSTPDYIDDIYILENPISTGVIPIKAELSFYDIDNRINFFSIIGASIYNLKNVIKVITSFDGTGIGNF